MRHLEFSILTCDLKRAGPLIHSGGRLYFLFTFSCSLLNRFYLCKNTGGGSVSANVADCIFWKPLLLQNVKKCWEKITSKKVKETPRSPKWSREVGLEPRMGSRWKGRWCWGCGMILVPLDFNSNAGERIYVRERSETETLVKIWDF